MSLKIKLSLSYIILILIFALVSGANSHLMNMSADDTTELINRIIYLQVEVQEAQSSVLRIHGDIWEDMIYSLEIREVLIEDVDKLATTFYDVIDLLIEETPEKAPMLESFKKVFRSYYLVSKRILAFPDIETYRQNKDMTALFDKYRNKLLDNLDNLVSEYRRDFEEAKHIIETHYANTRFSVLLSALVGILISIAVSLLQTRSLIVPVNVLNDYTKAVSDGNYKKNIDFKSYKEFNHLIKNFNRMVDAVRDREKAIIENEKKFRAIVQDQTELICRFTNENIMTFANKAYCKYFNKSFEELVGSEYIPNIPLDEFAFVLKEVRGLNKGNPVSTLEHTVILDGDKERWLRWTYRAIIGDDEEVLEYQAVGTDITEKRVFEESLRKAKREADEANRLKSEFIANMSHELRTPLNNIIGYSEEFLPKNIYDYFDCDTLEESNSKSDVKNFVENGVSVISEFGGYVYDSGKHLLVIVNDILDLAKIEAGKLYLNISTFKIEKITENIRHMFSKSIKEKGLDFSINIDEDIEVYWGDENRIAQILINLISNAVKFTNEGYIRIDIMKENDDVVYSVTDTGIGISKDKIDIVFDRFRQVDGSSNRKFGGTGLGLAICQNLVRMHDGKMWVESEPGMGSVFRFSIPNYKKEEVLNVKESQNTLR